LRCPVCGSNKINYSGMSTSVGGGYSSTDARYVCEDCEYVGALILDVGEDENTDNYTGDDSKITKKNKRNIC